MNVIDPKDFKICAHVNSVLYGFGKVEYTDIDSVRVLSYTGFFSSRLYI